MGFDIYGLQPENEKGKYFRNNVWGWKPLADYVLSYTEVPEKESKYWYTNDGQKVSKETAKINKPSPMGTIKKTRRKENGHNRKNKQKKENNRKRTTK